MEARETILRSRRVLLGDAPELSIRPAEIVLSGSRILSVTELDDDAPAPATTVEDFGDQLITPALINSHTHLTLNFLRAFDLNPALAGNLVEDLFFRIERQLTRDDVLAFARMGAYECLLSGTACVWDHYYHGDAITQALLETGLTGVVAPTLQDLSGPGQDVWESTLELTSQLHLDKRLRDAGVFAALGPHATDTVSPELFGRLAEQAHSQDLSIHVHVAQSAPEYRRSLERHGCSPIELLRRTGLFELAPLTLAVHCIYVSQDDLLRLNDLPVALVFCPYAARIFDIPADPRTWSRAGLTWSVATDCGASNDSMNLQKELRAVAELRTHPVSHGSAYRDFLARSRGTEDARALVDVVDVARSAALGEASVEAEPTRLLSRITSIPGRYHPGMTTGVIRPGALANLLVWDTNHPSFWPAPDSRSLIQLLSMGDTTGAIQAMYSGGRRIGQRGDFHRSILGSETFNEARIEADRRLAELMERL